MTEPKITYLPGAGASLIVRPLVKNCPLFENAWPKTAEGKDNSELIRRSAKKFAVNERGDRLCDCV